MLRGGGRESKGRYGECKLMVRGELREIIGGGGGVRVWVGGRR